MSDITLNVKAQANLQQAVSEIKGGMDAIIKACRGLAKTFKDLGNKEAVESFKNISETSKGLKGSLQEVNKILDGTAASSKKAGSALKEQETTFLAVKEKADQLAKAITKGKVTEEEALKIRKGLQKSLEDYVVVADKVTNGQHKMNREVSLSTLQELNRQGAIKMTANGFKILNIEAVKAFTSSETHQKLIARELNLQSLYNKEISNATQKTVEHIKAVKDLGLAFGYSDNLIDKPLKALKTLEEALKSIRNQIKASGGSEAGMKFDWLEGLNRAKIVIASVNKDVAITTQGIKALSQEGLNVLGIKSIESAQKLGVLDKSFDVLDKKLLQFQQVTKESDVNMKAMRDQLIASTKNFKEASAEVDKYIKTAVGTDRVKKTIADLVGKYNTLFATESKQRQKAQELIKTYQETGGNVKTLSQNLKNLNAEHKKEISDTTKVASSVRKLSVDYRELLNSQSKQGDQARRMLRAIKEHNADLEKGSNAIKRINSNWREASREAHGLAGAVDFIARSFKVYARYMIASTAIRGFVDGIRKVKDEIIAYDQSLHNLKAILNATDTEVSMLGETMLETVMNSKFSLTEVAGAMQLLGQAGFTAMETLGSIQAIADLATGTLEDLQSTVKLVTSAMTVFGSGADDAARVSDIFATAVNYSRLTIDSLNTSFNYIGPIAEEAELGLKDVTAAMMLMSNAGVRASTSATGFRRVLGVLASPTEAFKKAVAEAGYSLTEFDTRTNEMGDIISKLPNVVKTAGDAIKMFGLRGSAVITAFTGQGIGEFNRLKAKLDEVGAAARMAAEQQEGLGVTWDKIKNSIGVLSVKLGKSGFTAVIREASYAIREFLAFMVELVENPFSRFIIQITTAAAGAIAFATALRVISMLGVGNWFVKITSALKDVTAGFLGTTAASKASKDVIVKAATASSVAVGNLKDSVKSLSTAFMALTKSPIGIIISLITAAVTSLYLYNKKLTEDVAKLTEEMMKLGTAFDTVSQKIEKYKNVVKEFGEFSHQGIEAVEDLEHSIKELGKENYISAEEMVYFLSQIDRSTGTFKNQEKSIEELSNTIRQKYLTALKDTLAEQDKQAAKSRLLHSSISSYINLLKEIVLRTTGLIHGVKIWEQIKESFKDTAWMQSMLKDWGEMWDKIWGKAKTVIGADIDVSGAFDEYAKLMEDTFGVKVPQSIQDTMEKYLALKRLVEKGTAIEADVTRFETINEAVGKLAKEFLGSQDAASFTADQIERIVNTDERFRNLSDEMKGGLIKNLTEMAYASQRANSIHTATIDLLRETTKAYGEEEKDVLALAEIHAYALNKIKMDFEEKTRAMNKDSEEYKKYLADTTVSLNLVKERWAEVFKSMKVEEILKEKMQILDNVLADEMLRLEEKQAQRTLPITFRTEIDDSLDEAQLQLGNMVAKAKEMALVLPNMKIQDPEKFKELAQNFVELTNEGLKFGLAAEQSAKQYRNAITEINQTAAEKEREIENVISELRIEGIKQAEEYEKKYADKKIELADKVKAKQEEIKDVYEKIGETSARVADAEGKDQESLRRQLSKNYEELQKKQNELRDSRKKEREELRKLRLEQESQLESEKALRNEALKATEEAQKALENFKEEASEGNLKNYEYWIAKATDGWKEYGKTGTEANKEAQRQIEQNLLPTIGEFYDFQKQENEKAAKDWETMANNIKENFDQLIVSAGTLASDLRDAASIDPKSMSAFTDEMNRALEVAKELKKVMDEIQEKKLREDPNVGLLIPPEVKSKGGRVFHAAKGHRFPGNSTKDSIPVLARPGEGFIRNEALAVWDRALGKKFFDGINNPWSKEGKAILKSMTQSTGTAALTQAVEKFSKAGMNLTDMGNLNITVGNQGSFQVMGNVDVISQLKTALARENSMRVNT